MYDESANHETAHVVTSRPVAYVLGGREKIVDDQWDGVDAIIRLDASRFHEQALYGLDAFSHLEVVFHFPPGTAGEDRRRCPPPARQD